MESVWYVARVRNSFPRGLISILIFALLIRIALVIVQPMTVVSLDRLPDQREYFSIAENFLRHQTLCFFDPRFGQTVYAYRMPGYPIFLVMCGGAISIVRVAQCVIDTSTCLAVFLIASRLTGCMRVGRIAAALLAVNPFYVFFSSLILSETLFSSLIVWAIYCLLRFPDWRSILGIWLLVAATYVRPIGYLIMPMVGFAVTLNMPHRRAYRLSNGCWRSLLFTIPITLMFGFVLASTTLPWVCRNYKLLGSSIWTTTNGGITLYDGFHDGATGASDQRFVAGLPIIVSMNEVERSVFLSNQARKWTSAHRSELAGLSLRKIARTWSPIPLSPEFGKPIYIWISAAYAIPFDLLCFAGLFSLRLNSPAKILMVTPALVVTLGVVLSVGSIRYRMPAEAPLAVLAACGTMDVLKWVKSWK